MQCLTDRKRNHTTAAYFLLHVRDARKTPPGARFCAPSPAPNGSEMQGPCSTSVDGAPMDFCAGETSSPVTGLQGVQASSMLAAAKESTGVAQHPPTSPVFQALVPRPPAIPAPSGNSRRPHARADHCAALTGSGKHAPITTSDHAVTVPELQPNPPPTRPRAATKVAVDPQSRAVYDSMRGSNGRAGAAKLVQVEVVPYGTPMAPAGRPVNASSHQTKLDTRLSCRGTAHMVPMAPRRPSSGPRAAGRHSDCQRPVSAVSGQRVRASSGVSRVGVRSGSEAISTISAPTITPPRTLMADAIYLLDKSKINVLLLSPFVARCERHGLKFLMEVAATDVRQQFFVVRLQLQYGDASLFHDTAARVLPALVRNNAAP